MSLKYVPYAVPGDSENWELIELFLNEENIVCHTSDTLWPNQRLEISNSGPTLGTQLGTKRPNSTLAILARALVREGARCFESSENQNTFLSGQSSQHCISWTGEQWEFKLTDPDEVRQGTNIDVFIKFRIKCDWLYSLLLCACTRMRCVCGGGGLESPFDRRHSWKAVPAECAENPKLCFRNWKSEVSFSEAWKSCPGGSAVGDSEE